MISIIQAAGWPIWPLIISSMMAVALIVERFLSLRQQRVAPAKLLDEVIAVSSKSVPNADVVSKLSSSCLLGTVLASGLRALTLNPRCTDMELQEVMESAGREAVHVMDKYLGALATIASAAPLLGLLGTVIGMIEIFGSQSGGAGQGMGNPAQLAHGISVALYNTAFGLIVAIPALIFWRYFRARVDAYTLNMELASARFLRHLKHLRQSL